MKSPEMHQAQLQTLPCLFSCGTFQEEPEIQLGLGLGSGIAGNIFTLQIKGLRKKHIYKVLGFGSGYDLDAQTASIIHDTFSD